MRIEINHNDTTIYFDEFEPQDADNVIKIVNGTIDKIKSVEPVERPEIDLTKTPVDQYQCVDRKTLKPLEIHRTADECLRMLKYWDEYHLRDENGKFILDIKNANTMDVVKNFLTKLKDNFPGQ